MPIENIVISPSARQSSLLISAQASLQATINSLEQALAYMQQQTDGQDFTHVETQFGIPQGQGQTVNNLVANLVGNGGSLTVPNVTQFLAILN